MTDRYSPEIAGINSVIEEMMGFSPDSDQLADDIIKYVLDEVKSGNIIKVGDQVMDGVNIDVYTLTNTRACFRTGIDTYLFELDLKLINVSGTIPDDDIRHFSRSVGNGSACGFVDLLGIGVMNSYYLISNLVFSEWEMTNTSESIAKHEIMHAFTNMKRTGGMTPMDDEKTDYEKLYSAATEALTALLSQNLHKTGDGKKICTICWGIHNSNKSEISSFTQQAYIEMKSAKSFSDVDKIIKETDLYGGYKHILDAIVLLEADKTGELYEDIAKILALKGGKVPTKHKFMKMLNARIKKYQSNIGKIVVDTKDKLRHPAIKEGRMPVIMSNPWKDLYKIDYSNYCFGL